MADLRLVAGDVLAGQADALVITVDGTAVPRPDQYERILGNVGRQLLKRFPDAELIEEIESQVDFPLSLGSAALVQIENAPFRCVVIVSTLHHLDHLDNAAKRAVVRSSFASALDVAAQAGVETMATAVLQGGWRLSPEAAFGEMLSAVAAHSANLRTDVYCIDEKLCGHLAGLARSYGFK